MEGLAAFLAERYPQRAGAVLDLGAGTKPYAPLYEPRFERAVALDVGNEYYGDEISDVIAPGDAMPFEDETFDCVVCTEVLEHCPDPAAVLAEIRRVLKPGGATFVTTPFMLGLHDEPYDFFRYTPHALRLLGEQAGLAVDSVEPRGDWPALALGVWLFPVTRALRLLFRGLYRYENPVVWLLVAAPQLLYLRYWRAFRGSNGRLARQLSGTPLGFLTVMTRPDGRPARSR